MNGPRRTTAGDCFIQNSACRAGIVALASGEQPEGLGVLGAHDARGEVPQKAHLGLPAEAGGEQVDNLGDHKIGNEERPRIGLE